MFWVANYVLSKKHLAMKRVVQNIALLRKLFPGSYLENAMKNGTKQKGTNNEIIQLKTISRVDKANFLMVNF